MRVKVVVAYDVRIQGAVPDADELADHLDDVLDALMDHPNLEDPDVDATLAEGHVEISLVPDAVEGLAAAEQGVAAVRGAIKVAHGRSDQAKNPLLEQAPYQRTPRDSQSEDDTPEAKAAVPLGARQAESVLQLRDLDALHGYI